MKNVTEATTNVTETATTTKAPVSAKAPAKKAPKAAKASATKKAAKATKTAPKVTARPGSKTEKVLAMMQRAKGATGPEIMKATGWQAHTVRGFISAVIGKKLGLKVTSEATEKGQSYKVAA